jgi:hypothetical protein
MLPSSAGGGGNSQARQAKIRHKNEKLATERKHRMQAEEREKDERRVKAADESEEVSSVGMVHPSRRAMVEGALERK